MPIKKICNKSGCSSLLDIGQKYCDKHKLQEQIDKAERNRYYDQYIRNKEATAFYHSVEWQQVRQQRLIIDNYLCQDCLNDKRFTPADVVDHIKPIEWFWELRLSLDNTRCLCHRHHQRKTAEDKKLYEVKENNK